jgi:hypothetical protein
MMFMLRPAEAITPYSLSPWRTSRVEYPVELLRMTELPSRTTTPDSLLAVPRRVEVNRYVASSLISSMTSLLRTDVESVPTGQTSPRHVPLSSPGETAAAGSDKLDVGPELWAAHPPMRIVRAMQPSLVTMLAIVR